MTGNDPDGTTRRSARHYKPDSKEAFMTELVAKYRYHTIYFDDDAFNRGDKHVERLVMVMRRINVACSAMCRAETIRMDLWRKMKDSGCFGVKIGFESGNQEVVHAILSKRHIAALELDTLQQSGCAEIEGMPPHTLIAHALETYSAAKPNDGYVREPGGRVKFDRPPGMLPMKT